MVSASSSKQQNIQSIDDLVAIIASADAAAVHDTLIPALTRLHKASGKDKKGDDLLVRLLVHGLELDLKQHQKSISIYVHDIQNEKAESTNQSHNSTLPVMIPNQTSPQTFQKIKTQLKPKPKP